MSADYFALATEQVREAGRRIAKKRGTTEGVTGRMGPGESLAGKCMRCPAWLTPTAKSFHDRGVPLSHGLCPACRDRELAAAEAMEVSDGNA